LLIVRGVENFFGGEIVWRKAWATFAISVTRGARLHPMDVR
jgi:hypothetical protein